VPTLVAVSSGEPGAPVMLRDPRLDELLAEHRQAVGVTALGGSTGFLRNATFEGVER
jgi:sigma-E factor negative regulatory protein RseA